MNLNLSLTGDPVRQEFAEKAEDWTFRYVIEDLEASNDGDEETGIAYWLAEVVTSYLWFLCAELSDKKTSTHGQWGSAIASVKSLFGIRLSGK